MRSNYYKTLATLFSLALHPLVVPTLGVLLVMGYLPGLELYSFKAKLFLLAVVFVSTFLLPLIFAGVMLLSPGADRQFSHHKERIIPYFFTAISIFMGSQFLARLPFPSVFRLILLGTTAILVILFMVTIWWKIAGHTAGMGGLLGTLLALTFKYGLDLFYPTVAVVLLSGMVASSLLYLEKHTSMQLGAGFGVSVSVLFFMVYFF
jgi:hypothetical protein